MSTAPRPYGGVPQDERRAERRERLLDALLDVVAADGVEGVTVAAVTSGAGVGKRYFYESFASVDALLTEALGRVFADVGAAITASRVGPTDSPREVLRIAASSALDAMADPRVARLYLEVSGSPMGAAAREVGVTLLVDHLLTRIVDAPPPPAARLLGQLLVAGTHHAVALWLRGETPIGREELIDLLVDTGADAAERMRTLATAASQD